MDLSLLNAFREPAALIDPDGVVVGLNAAAAALVPQDLGTGASFADAFLDPAERGGFAEVVALVAGGHDWTGSLHCPAVDHGPVRVDATAVSSDGGELRLLVRLLPPSVDNADLADRLGRLAQVSAELLHATTLETVTDTVVEHLADAAGATTASFSVRVDEDTLALVGLRGGTPGAASRWATYAIDSSTPAGEAVRTADNVVLVGRSAIEERFPGLDLAAEGERSMVCLPLTVQGRVVGAVSLSFPYRRELDDAELRFLRLLTDSCAQALERLRAEEAAHDQATKLEFLAEASAELASSLDYESTLRNVAWLAVPRFADWATVGLEENGLLRTIAVAHSDPEKLALAEAYQDKYPPDPNAQTGSYQVLRTGQSLLMPEITEDQLVAAAEGPEQLEMLHALDFRSALVVPLKARRRTLGTLTWVSGETGRRFGPADIGFGEDLARRAAIAIDNALLHRDLQEIAEGLQEAVRQPELQDRPGWELAAVFRPPAGTDVGGDFYDAIEVDDDRLAVFVGDVMGKGVRAAAAMAQIRAAVRTAASVDPQPAAVMGNLDSFFEHYPTDQLVTLAYGLADRSREEFVLAAAGHPPPLLLRSDGTGRYLDEARGLVLGVMAQERMPVRVPFAVGDTLLMYTDGLVERRSEDLELSKRRLIDTAVAIGGGLPLQDLVRRLVADAARDASDDVAVVAVRARG